jgi:hypothetical protein
MRNAVEHPEGKRVPLHISNVELVGQNSERRLFQEPVWFLQGDPPARIVEDRAPLYRVISPKHWVGTQLEGVYPMSLSPKARQIRKTECSEIPASLAMSRLLQWVRGDPIHTAQLTCEPARHV